MKETSRDTVEAKKLQDYQPEILFSYGQSVLVNGVHYVKDEHGNMARSDPQPFTLAEPKPVQRFQTGDEVSNGKKIPLVEAFGPTVQGEGLLAGTITTFLRFGLCDYRCGMCDSMHAVDPAQVKAGAKWLNQEELFHTWAEVQGLYNPKSDDPWMRGTEPPVADWVTFSGGNPCIHDLSELVHGIKEFKYGSGIDVKIAVETQGTLLPTWLHMCDVITCSPKTPGMKEKFEQDKFLNFVWAFRNHPGFNIKAVVFTPEDLEFVKHINTIAYMNGLEDRVYLSLGNPYPPGQDKDVSTGGLKLQLLDEYRLLTEDLLKEPFLRNVKFLPQIHVLTWGNKQGV
jgi:7-carboxy-7-deazaguanine synthase